MRSAGAAVLIGLALASTACGSDSEETDRFATNGIADVIDTNSKEEAAVLGVVRQYGRGLAEKDWAAVCDARIEEEQRDLGESLAGGCEQAMELAFDFEEFVEVGELVATSEPESISIRGDRATIDYGDGSPFYAVREDGEWKLIEDDSNDGDEPSDFDDFGYTGESCGVDEAAAIAGRLQRAGYETEPSENQDDTFTRVNIEVPELPDYSSPFVDVYCTSDGVQEEARKLENLPVVPGVEYSAFKPAGRALYSVVVAPDIADRPPLQPIINEIAEVGSP